MTLKEFLAVGRSFAGPPREKSPFEMRKDIRLPIFENTPRFSARHPVAMQTDWLTEKQPRSIPPDGGSNAGRETRKKAVRKKTWLEILTFGLVGQRKPASQFVQEEMVLENVRVMRNDLEDSDLEVVVNKNKKFALRTAKPPQAPAKAEVPAKPATPPPMPKAGPAKKRMEWSELTAKLFEIGQQQ